MGDLTPWFPGNVKPARKGVYESESPVFPGRFIYRMWDGAQWLLFAHSPESAASERDRSGYQRLQWRGLAKEPK